MYKEVVIVGDGSGHEFVIPVELQDRFAKLLEDEDNLDLFDKEFVKYMCGGGTKLYIKVDGD